MKGGTVCRMHGGMAPQVARKAAVRVTLQEMLRELPEDVTWAEMYEEALRVNYVIMRHARNKVEQGETLDPAEIDALQQSSARVASIAKGAHDIGISERIAQSVEQRDDRAAHDIAIWYRLMVDGMAEGWHVDVFHVHRLRQWQHDAAMAFQRGDEKPPPLPQPPRPGEPCRHAVSGPQTYCRQPLRDDGTCASGHLTLVLRDAPTTTVEQLTLPAPPGHVDGEDPDRPQNATADDDPRLSGHPEDAEDVSGDVDVVDAEVIEPGPWRSHGRWR